MIDVTPLETPTVASGVDGIESVEDRWIHTLLALPPVVGAVQVMVFWSSPAVTLTEVTGPGTDVPVELLTGVMVPVDATMSPQVALPPTEPSYAAYSLSFEPIPRLCQMPGPSWVVVHEEPDIVASSIYSKGSPFVGLL